LQQNRNATSCECDSFASFTFLLGHFRRLERLDLCGCRNLLTSRGLVHVANTCTSLTELNIDCVQESVDNATGKIFLPAGAKKSVVEKEKLSLLVEQNILKVWLTSYGTIFLNPLIVVKSENFASILSEHSKLFYLPFFQFEGRTFGKLATL
jgi:hypothetical protein